MNLHPCCHRLLPLAVLLSLTGCFEVRQNLMVYEDGDADLMFTVALTEEVAAMTDKDDNSDAECDNDFGFDQALPPSLKKTTNVRIEDDQVLCDVVVFGPLLDMIPVLDDYNAQQDDDDFVSIEALGNGRFRLTGQYAFDDATADVDEDSGLGRAIRGAVIASLENAQITWEVRAPHIIDTNGERQTDGSVIWGFPLSDVILNGGTRRFEVTFETTPRPQFF